MPSFSGCPWSSNFLATSSPDAPFLQSDLPVVRPTFTHSYISLLCQGQRDKDDRNFARVQHKADMQIKADKKEPGHRALEGWEKETVSMCVGYV